MEKWRFQATFRNQARTFQEIKIYILSEIFIRPSIYIYMYVEHKYPERRTIWYVTSYLYHIYNYKEYIFWNKECNTIRWPPTYGEICISLFLIYNYKFVCTSSFKNSIITNLIWFVSAFSLTKFADELNTCVVIFYNCRLFTLHGNNKCLLSSSANLHEYRL